MFIFGMKAHLINMHLLVLRSRSSAKVKVEYQGYISQKKNGRFEGISTESCFRHPLFDQRGTRKVEIRQKLTSTFLAKKLPRKVEKLKVLT